MFEVFRSTSSKLVLLLAVVLIAGLQYQFWLGEGGYFPHQALTQQITQQAEVNDELKERNRILAAEVYDLKKWCRSHRGTCAVRLRFSQT